MTMTLILSRQQDEQITVIKAPMARLEETDVLCVLDWGFGIHKKKILTKFLSQSVNMFVSDNLSLSRCPLSSYRVYFGNVCSTLFT